VFVHVDGIEIANFLAITEAEAAPETGLATTGDKRCGPTRAYALVMRPVTGDIDATGTRESCHNFFFGANVHAEEASNILSLIFIHNRAFAWQGLATDHGFGKPEATGVPAGTAVCSRQHQECRIDAGVLVDVQFPVRQNQEGGKQKSERRKRQNSYRHAVILAHSEKLF
jgi:hypothetical protein